MGRDDNNFPPLARCRSRLNRLALLPCSCTVRMKYRILAAFQSHDGYTNRSSSVSCRQSCFTLNSRSCSGSPSLEQSHFATSVVPHTTSSLFSTDLILSCRFRSHLSDFNLHTNSQPPPCPSPPVPSRKNNNPNQTAPVKRSLAQPNKSTTATQTQATARARNRAATAANARSNSNPRRTRCPRSKRTSRPRPTPRPCSRSNTSGPTARRWMGR